MSVVVRYCRKWMTETEERQSMPANRQPNSQEMESSVEDRHSGRITMSDIMRVVAGGWSCSVIRMCSNFIWWVTLPVE